MPSSAARPLTLGRLARLTGLARASLLHYESLGLLKPDKRNASGYRLYGTNEVDRLRSIRRYRDAGLSLKAIGALLGVRSRTPSASEPAQILEQRWLTLCQEMETLRTQQKQLARLLASPALRTGRVGNTKEAWVAMLRRAGMNDDEMHEWHRSFEADDPRGHSAFLRSLGLATKEVARIRRWSRSASVEVIT